MSSLSAIGLYQALENIYAMDCERIRIEMIMYFERNYEHGNNSSSHPCLVDTHGSLVSIVDDTIEFWTSKTIRI